jgi:hypothetical protein
LTTAGALPVSTIAVLPEIGVTGKPFKEEGSSPAQYDASDSCQGSGSSPFIIKLADGHQIEFVAVDPGSIVCGGNNDPQIGGCRFLVHTAFSWRCERAEPDAAIDQLALLGQNTQFIQ